MINYLLDTNIVSDLVRNPQGPIAAHLRKVGESRIATSIIVASELRHGAEMAKEAASTSPNPSVGTGARGTTDIALFESPADEFYGRIRVELEAVGKPIGSNGSLDCSACILSLGHTLVTDNTREFSRVRSLKVENWIRP